MCNLGRVRADFAHSAIVGGVGQLYQGDLDLGRRAVERLSREDLGRDVLVEDFHYGAVAVAQRLQEIKPDALVLVGAESKGRAPGSVVRERIELHEPPAEEAQSAVAEAVTGYVTVALVVEVGMGLGALPARTVVIEVEPAQREPSLNMSPDAEIGLERALDLVRAEVRSIPLLRVADEIRALISEGRMQASPAREAMTALLDELVFLDREGRWGRTFALRDRVRGAISQGRTSEGMSHVDWGLWWGLIEELDRLQPLEATLL